MSAQSKVAILWLCIALSGCGPTAAELDAAARARSFSGLKRSFYLSAQVKVRIIEINLDALVQTVMRYNRDEAWQKDYRSQLAALRLIASQLRQTPLPAPQLEPVHRALQRTATSCEAVTNQLGIWATSLQQQKPADAQLDLKIAMTLARDCRAAVTTVREEMAK